MERLRTKQEYFGGAAIVVKSSCSPQRLAPDQPTLQWAPIQEHKEYSGTMATGAGSDQHSELHSKLVLQISTCNYCPSWKWTSLGWKDLKDLPRRSLSEQVRYQRTSVAWCQLVKPKQRMQQDSLFVQCLHRQGTCQRLPLPAPVLCPNCLMRHWLLCNITASTT